MWFFDKSFNSKKAGTSIPEENQNDRCRQLGLSSNKVNQGNTYSYGNDDIQGSN